METSAVKRKGYRMPDLCLYRNCHNLGSRIFEGYCMESHLVRGMKDAGNTITSKADYEKEKAEREMWRIAEVALWSAILAPSKEQTLTPPDKLPNSSG